MRLLIREFIGLALELCRLYVHRQCERGYHDWRPSWPNRDVKACRDCGEVWS